MMHQKTLMASYRVCLKLDSRVAKRQTAHSTVKGLGNFLEP